MAGGYSNLDIVSSFEIRISDLNPDFDSANASDLSGLASTFTLSDSLPFGTSLWQWTPNRVYGNLSDFVNLKHGYRVTGQGELWPEEMVLISSVCSVR